MGKWGSMDSEDAIAIVATDDHIATWNRYGAELERIDPELFEELLARIAAAIYTRRMAIRAAQKLSDLA